MSRFRQTAYAWAIATAAALAALAVGSDLAPLKQSDRNPHYLEWRGKPIIAISSGEHYGALVNSEFDYVAYFDELASNQLNHTRVFVGTYRETPVSFGITKNTLSPAAGDFICPWARSDQPGAWDGGNKFDLSRWDDAYFQRLRDLTDQAQKRDILIEFVLFCPMYESDNWQACPWNERNNVNGLGHVPREKALSLSDPRLVAVQLSVVKKLVQELNDFGNFYFEICNEPYSRDVPMRWQEKIIDCITDTENGLPKRHLISLNYANKTAKIIDPHPAVAIYNFHYCVPPTAPLDNYDLNKIIGENETGFRGRADAIYRTEAWDFMLSGGAIFNNLDYSFTAEHPTGSFTQYTSPGGGSPQLRSQLGVLREFLETFAFADMQPVPDAVTGLAAGLTARALIEEGKQYAIYLHRKLPWKPLSADLDPGSSHTAQFQVKLPRGAYEAEWIAPISGEVVARNELQPPSGPSRFRSPPFQLDIALRIVRKQGDNGT